MYKAAFLDASYTCSVRVSLLSKYACHHLHGFLRPRNSFSASPGAIIFLYLCLASPRHDLILSCLASPRPRKFCLGLGLVKTASPTSLSITMICDRCDHYSIAPVQSIRWPRSNPICRPTVSFTTVPCHVHNH